MFLSLTHFFGKLYNRSLVSTQLDAAAHRLALTISRRGYEHPPNPFARVETCDGRFFAKIKRNQYPLAFKLARENQEIRVRADCSITAEQQRLSSASQIDQSTMQLINRCSVSSLIGDVVLVKPIAQGQPRRGA